MNLVPQLLCLIICFTVAGCQDKSVQFALGTLERDRVELVSGHSEVVQAVFVSDGEEVRRGQALMQLDSRSVDAQLAAVMALKEQMAARFSELERGPRQELIAQAKAVLMGSSSQLVEAEHNFSRISALNKKQLASQSQLDQASASYDIATAKSVADQQALAALENGTTAEQLQQARQALLQAEANIIPAQIQQQKLTITAPRDGAVDQILYEVGEQPSASAVLAVLLASDRYYARVYIPQSHRGSVIAGKSIIVHIDGVLQPLTGKVSWVSSDPAFTPYFALTERDRSRLVYLAEIDLNLDDVKKLPAGLPIQVELETLQD